MKDKNSQQSPKQSTRMVEPEATERLKKFGRDLMIREGDLRLVEDRKVGRPPKAPSAKRKAIAKS